MSKWNKSNQIKKSHQYNKCPNCNLIKDKRSRLCRLCRFQISFLKYSSRKCPRCENGILISRGFYYVQSGEKRRRLSCKKCKRFISDVLSLYSPIKLDIQEQIIDLINAEEFEPTRYDNRGSTFLSSRKLSKLIKKRFKIKLSKSACADWIKRYRIGKGWRRSLLGLKKMRKLEELKLARLKKTLEKMPDDKVY